MSLFICRASLGRAGHRMLGHHGHGGGGGGAAIAPPPSLRGGQMRAQNEMDFDEPAHFGANRGGAMGVGGGGGGRGGHNSWGGNRNNDSWGGGGRGGGHRGGGYNQVRLHFLCCVVVRPYFSLGLLLHSTWFVFFLG